jgi:hypothetical protein
MQKISKATETKLVEALAKVTDLVHDGDTPSEAIIKVAQASDMPIGQVQLMIQAYNNARFTRQHKSASIIAEKTANFTLANPNLILEELYPTNVKEVQAQSLRGPTVSDEYTRPPRLEEPEALFKQATHVLPRPQYPQEPQRFMKRAYSLLKELEFEHVEKRRQLSATQTKAALALEGLADYFRQVYHTPFAEVKEASIALYGPEVEPIFNHVLDMVPQLRREKYDGLQKVAVDQRREPYSLVRQCLQQTNEYVERLEVLNQFSKEAGEASHNVIQHFIPVPPPVIRGSIIQHRKHEKSADGLGDALGNFGSSIAATATGTALGKQLMEEGDPKPRSSLTEDATLKLMDPGHSQKLRGIRAKATFNDLMANDELLQGSDPEHAAKIYNEIAQVSPRAVDQPLLMRALMRRAISQGSTDPHDVQQLADIEGKLKAREEAIEPGELPGIAYGRRGGVAK